MKLKLLYLFCSLSTSAVLAQESKLIKAGEKAPSFVLNRGENAIQGFTMPYLNKIVLLHFWNTQTTNSSKRNKFLNQISEKYMDSEYINAEGFEVIAIAVQNDRTTWKAAIQRDSLTNFTHGIALKGFQEEDVCLKFGVEKVPNDILINENAEVILINPRMIDLENYLDSKKNVHPIKKDYYGAFALSSSPQDKLRFSKVYLFNQFGDTIAFTRTNENGIFVFTDLKSNQNYVFKLDNHLDIITSDPAALYSTEGELLIRGETKDGGFVFNVPSHLNYKLQLADTSKNSNPPHEITVVKYLNFKGQNGGLNKQDEVEIAGLLSTLEKNSKSMLEIVVHSDSKQNERESKQLSDKQAQVLKNYFLAKGIPTNHLRVISLGNTQPVLKCEPNCSEEDHKKNKRVEFTILKT